MTKQNLNFFKDYLSSDTRKNNTLFQMVELLKKYKSLKDNNIIRFSLVHKILGRFYPLNQEGRYFFIGEMRRARLIEIIPHNGIIIKGNNNI